mgnify:CR=1 FL=1
MTLNELLARFGEVEQQGDGFLVHCPAHNDSHPSLRVSVTPDGTALVKCRAGCETQDVLSAVGLQFSDLYNVSSDGSVTVSNDPMLPLSPGSIAALRQQLDAYSGLSEAAAEYARSRFGLTAEDAVRCELGSTSDLPGGERLVVPFRDPDGVALGFQARALEPGAAVRWYGPRNPEQGSWSRVGFFPGSARFDQVLVTEGPGDALTASAAGYDAIAIRGASIASEAVVRSLVDWADGRMLVLAGDGDAAGRRFNSVLVRSLAEAGCKVQALDVPDGLDLTDWRAQDPEVFPVRLQAAVSALVPVSTLDSVLMQRDEARFPLTDLGNARFVADLAAREGTPIRYVEELGFLLLTNGVWVEDRMDRARALVHRASDLVREIAEKVEELTAGDMSQAGLVARWRKAADYLQSSKGIQAVLREVVALSDVATAVEDLDQHDHLLAARNGVIDLRSGRLMEHNGDLLLTRRLDVDYIPGAAASRWVEYLREVMCGDEEMVAYLKRLVGYAITGETSEQCFTVLWGSGANGKTVFTSTLSTIFSPISEITPFSTFEAKPSGGVPNDLAALRAARMVFASEGEADKPMAESLLKRITGRDPVTARFLRKEYFTFSPKFQLFLATNNKPAFRGADDGLWRRVKLVAWQRFFAPDERDAGIFDALLAEREGILAWAVEGAVEWYRDGLCDPETIVRSTQEYRSTSDSLAGFFPGVYVKDENAGRVPGKKLFEDYLDWTRAENLQPNEVVTRRKFFSMLDERGLVKRKSDKGVVFEQVRRARPSDSVGDAA